MEIHNTSCLRHTFDEACTLLRVSRSTLYSRIRSGAIRVHHDGTRTYVSAAELTRYIERIERGEFNSTEAA